MKRTFIILTAILLSANCFGQNSALNKIEFTNQYLKMLNSTFPNIEYEVVDSLGIMGWINGDEILHSLDNAYLEYIEDPELKEDVFNKYLNATKEIYGEQNDYQNDKIVPIIKPTDFLNSGTINGKTLDNFNFVYEAYNENLVIIYAEDKETTISYLDISEIEQRGVSRKNLLENSVINLNAIIPTIERNGDSTQFMLSAGGYYESSLILMENLWTKENFPVKGSIIIAIPNRDIILITGSEEKNGVLELKKLCSKSFNEGSYPISESLYIWNGEKFIEYK
jgi:uncharacterized protein YtpQ (UPF0354 family)